MIYNYHMNEQDLGNIHQDDSNTWHNHWACNIRLASHCTHMWFSRGWSVNAHEPQLIATIIHYMPSNVKTIHLRINCHLSIAIFENHIDSVVGGQLARNGIPRHACGEEGNHQKSYMDPLTNSTTHSTHESSHVFATTISSQNGAMNFFLHVAWANMTWQQHRLMQCGHNDNNRAWWNTFAKDVVQWYFP